MDFIMDLWPDCLIVNLNERVSTISTIKQFNNQTIFTPMAV
jgi:hypothetical protein